MKYYFVKETEKDKFKVITYGGDGCTWTDANYYLFFRLIPEATEESEYEAKGKEISKEEYLKLVEDNEDRVFVHYLSNKPGPYTYPDGDKDRLFGDMLTDFNNSGFFETMWQKRENIKESWD